jgi:hypothetical protein
MGENRSGYMALVIIAGLALWFFVGEPRVTIANWIWPETPAPWEDVDAVYYPDRDNSLVDVSAPHVGTVEACRAWVYDRAAGNSDPALTRGDYECGVGSLRNMGSLRVYRLTVR